MAAGAGGGWCGVWWGCKKGVFLGVGLGSGCGFGISSPAVGGKEVFVGWLGGVGWLVCAWWVGVVVGVVVSCRVLNSFFLFIAMFSYPVLSFVFYYVGRWNQKAPWNRAYVD